jgi:hypothetical protein
MEASGRNCERRGGRGLGHDDAGQGQRGAAPRSRAEPVACEPEAPAPCASRSSAAGPTSGRGSRVRSRRRPDEERAPDVQPRGSSTSRSASAITPKPTKAASQLVIAWRVASHQRDLEPRKPGTAGPCDLERFGLPVIEEQGRTQVVLEKSGITVAVGGAGAPRRSRLLSTLP